MFQKKGYRGGARSNRTTNATQLKGFFDGLWKCDCNPRLPACSFEVKKESPNKGRWFYTCQKPDRQRCGFFLWREDAQLHEASVVMANSRSEPIPEPARYQTKQEETDERPHLPAPYLPDDTPSKSSRSFTTVKKSEVSFDMSSEDERALFGEAVESEQRQSRKKPGFAAPRSYTTPKKSSSRFDMLSEDERALLAAPVESGRSSRRKPLFVSPQYTTPAKRRLGDIVRADESGGLMTPETNSKRQKASVTKEAELADEFLDFVSPHSTPTLAPRDAVAGPELWMQVEDVLLQERVQIGEEARARMKKVCEVYARKGQGLQRARDILRKALHARESKVSELQQRIATLEAELDTERDIIRYLRMDAAARDVG